MNSRIVLIFILMSLGWGALITRSAQLQILPNKRLGELQRRQYKTLIDLPARRGVISDRSGKELAVTIPAYSLYADPKEIDNPRVFAKQVAKKLGLSYAFVFERIKNRERRFVWLKRRMKKEYADSVMALRLRGLGVVEETERIYPNEKLLSQVLGFVGQEGQGLEGLELRFDKKLKGENRKIKIERDARGRPLLVDGRVFTDIPAGSDLTLTVDHELQFMLDNQLARAISEYNADSAVGIVLDAQTSEILAISNAPTFDSNRPQDFNREFLRNRVVTDAFEPGSTIKPFVIASGLKGGVLKPSSKYFCENGRFKVGPHFIREADKAHSFGTLTVTEILAQSSNIGTAKIALKLKSQAVRETLSDFGFGQRLNIDLPGESTGILHALPWRDHLLANISFGHGFTATPLQIAAAYAAIANGGMLNKPFIVKSSFNHETGEGEEFKPMPIRRVLSSEQSATLRLMLNAATSKTATGKHAQIPGFPVAGKTGTAQKIIVGQGYAKNQYISSFAGFVPVNDPRYVIYVAIDNPRIKYYGSEVAAPLFARVAGYAVRRGGLSPVLISEQNVMSETSQDKNEQVRSQSILKIREMAKVLSADEQNVTPDFTGLTLREVLNRVRGTPLKVNTRGEGVVSLSIPAPGEVLPDDKTVQLYFDP